MNSFDLRHLKPNNQTATTMHKFLKNQSLYFKELTQDLDFKADFNGLAKYSNSALQIITFCHSNPFCFQPA